MTTLPHPDVVGVDVHGLRGGLDLDLLGGRTDDVALHTALHTITYGQLAELVATESALLGTDRRVVVLEARNDVDTVVRFLAAWSGQHPVVLLGVEDAGRHHEIAERYADVVGEGLHRDLALLLSTSGSTGSPKLVRLSRANVLANARSIAGYLKLEADDRAITSLPLHYCYGLSVLTSHLVAGAAVVLTDLSVVDECFWDLARRTRATSFAGVPYTFDLLDAGRFAERDLPDLRHVTQAGGRLAPDTVRQYAELGRRRGWDFFVMYGATEATARMAYLPPGMAAERPEAIGVPVPGGDFRIEPVDDLDLEVGTGELVYIGPNVMMGYATEPADLARGAEVVELRTGDLGRQADDGLWEVLGRLDRHAKIFGLRLDLARIEVAVPGDVVLVAHGDRLHAFFDRPRRASATHDGVVAASGLPPSAVVVHELVGLPTTGRGKVDHAALRRHAAAVEAQATEQPGAPMDGPVSAEAVRDVYAVLLGRPDAHVDDSFVDLHGDSLSFVEVSTRLAAILGDLPSGWHHLSPSYLVDHGRQPRRVTVPVDPATLLRALAIVAIVVSHTDLAVIMGGAHVLLAVAGFNLARFNLGVQGRIPRARRILGGLATTVVPASLWIGVTGAITGDYDPATALYLNQLVGSETWTSDWQFWFFEVLVWTYLGIALLLMTPWLDRRQRAHPFGAALVVVLASVALRYAVVGHTAHDLEEYAVGAAVCCVALGWAAAEARTPLQRFVVSLLVVGGLWGFFGDDPQRQGIAIMGIMFLVVGRPVRVPRHVATALAAVAHASLWIYLTHWQVYPLLEDAGHRVLAAVASVVVGLASAWLYKRARTCVRRCRPSVDHLSRRVIGADVRCQSRGPRTGSAAQFTSRSLRPSAGRGTAR